jgi:hypothetical protein
MDEGQDILSDLKYAIQESLDEWIFPMGSGF